jgi:hypothetical protein
LNSKVLEIIKNNLSLSVNYLRYKGSIENIGGKI